MIINKFTNIRSKVNEKKEITLIYNYFPTISNVIVICLRICDCRSLIFCDHCEKLLSSK